MSLWCSKTFLYLDDHLFPQISGIILLNIFSMSLACTFSSSLPITYKFGLLMVSQKSVHIFSVSLTILVHLPGLQALMLHFSLDLICWGDLKLDLKKFYYCRIVNF
jgi:hypothetical protein